MDIYNTPPPPPRTKTARLTEEMKALLPGQSVIVDEKTALCIAAFYKYNGKRTTRRAIADGKFQIWIIE